MSDCSWLSDRMPTVALGKAEWTVDEALHLSRCSSCGREWELLLAVSRLGDRPVAGIDIPSVTRALHHRLRQGPERKRKRKAWGFTGLAAAAALAALLWSGQVKPPLRPTTAAPAVAGLQIPLPELEELQPAELDTVLRGLDQPVPDIDTLETTDSGATDAPQLETVYDYWEG